jgi:hypothetical protein
MAFIQPQLFNAGFPTTFQGETFVAELDAVRLSGLLECVFGVMKDGRWRTLDEIKAATNRGTEASISARLRDLRKPKFGGYTVNRRRRGDAKKGIHEYQLKI